MSPLGEPALAIAKVQGTEWTWHLLRDSLGRYRWYLNGIVPMNIRASTREKAEAALRRFVERTFRGELLFTPH